MNLLFASENADMAGALLWVAVCVVAIIVGCVKGW